MSVIGIDLGTTSSVVAVIRAGGIDIVVNEVSNRRTPSVLGFTDKLRTIGESGFTGRQRNTKNTVSGVKRLLGRKFSDPLLKSELSRLGGCNWVELEDGSVGVEVSLRNRKHTFTTQQLAAMLISHLREACEKYTRTRASNIVLSVPGYYSDSQRRALFDACKIANITCLQLINDLSACALFYGFYRETEKIDSKVMFVDIGAADTSIAIAHFTPGQCQMLAYTYDANLGGFDIDQILADYFAERLQKKIGFDAKKNSRAWQRIMDAVEKVKKTLNENERASINIECINEDKDMNDNITRTDYLELLNKSGLLDKLAVPIKAALAEANLDASQIEFVEWIGSAMRALPFQEGVSRAVGKPLSSTLNAEETVAKGCSLACALVSPLIKLGKKYKFIDIQPTPISLTWRTLNDPSDTKETGIELFPKKQHFGKTKFVTITRKDARPFEFSIAYSQPNENPIPDISNGTVAIGKVNSITKTENSTPDAEIRLKIKIEPSGTTNVTEVELVEKKEVEVEVPLPPAPQPTPAPATPAPAADPAAPAPATPAPETKDVDMKDAKEEPKTRKEKQIKTFYSKIPCQVTYKELPNSEIEKGVSLLQTLQKDDQYSIDTLHAKNKLEATALKVRGNLTGVWNGFSTDGESEKINTMSADIEDWLYNEGDDETKEVYEAKIAALAALTDPIEKRSFEWENVPPALTTLRNYLTATRADITNSGDKYSHIDKADMDKVVAKIDEAENWLVPFLPQHEKLTKTSAPIFNSSDLQQRYQNVSKFCQQVLSKPKPAPPPAPKEEPAPAPAQQTPEQKTQTPAPDAKPQGTDKMEDIVD